MTKSLKILAAVLTLSVLGGLSSASAGPDFNLDAPTYFKQVHDRAP